MMVYKTPSIEAFRNRKRFHATQKTHSESTSDWFKRLQKCLNNCNFDYISDYMLIDKFLSGLNETEFEKMLQVPNWTIDELILVVIGNAHIFNTKACTNAKLPSKTGVTDATNQNNKDDNERFHIKSEDMTEIQMNDAQNEADENFYDESNEDNSEQNRSETEIIISNNSNPPSTTQRKTRLSATEKNKRHIEKLKAIGKYDEFRRKHAENAKKRRNKAKQNEKYLPPEIQMHVLNERRRAIRERVKRYRQRKSQQTTQIDESESVEPNVVWVEMNPKSEPDFGNKTESEAEQENASNIEPGSDFEPEPESKSEHKPEFESRPKRTRPPKKIEKKVSIAAKPKSTYARKRTFVCYLCSLPCSKIYELKAHLSIFHPPEMKPLLQCPHCPKTSISRKVLSKHLKTIHGEFRVYKCSCCEEEFTKRSQLDQHNSHHHPDYKPFICETCGYSCKTNPELNSHSRRHTGEKNYKCEICGASLASRSGYRNHLLIHTGDKPHPCQFCDRYFRQTSSLRKHLILVHKKGEKPYLCNTCGKRFVSTYHLKLHMNSHTGSRPYKCEHCTSDFTQPSSLRLHVRRVHKMQP